MILTLTIPDADADATRSAIASGLHAAATFHRSDRGHDAEDLPKLAALAGRLDALADEVEAAVERSPIPLSDRTLSALVALARDAWLSQYTAGVPAIAPLPGDLVVAIEGVPRRATGLDPDAIGFLVAHGNAPAAADIRGVAPSDPVREVWDVRPLSRRRGPQGDFLRWENITFARVTPRVAEFVEAMRDETHSTRGSK